MYSACNSIKSRTLYSPNMTSCRAYCVWNAFGTNARSRLKQPISNLSCTTLPCTRNELVGRSWRVYLITHTEHIQSLEKDKNDRMNERTKKETHLKRNKMKCCVTRGTHFCFHFPCTQHQKRASIGITKWGWQFSIDFITDFSASNVKVEMIRTVKMDEINHRALITLEAFFVKSFQWLERWGIMWCGAWHSIL